MKVLAALMAVFAVSAPGMAPPAFADASQTATITGTVSGEPGYGSFSSPPIAGAVVSVSDGAGAGGSATTDSSGNFTISGLPAPDTYTLTVTATGYSSQTVTGISVAAGDTVMETLQLPPLPPTLSGTVTDGSGRAVYGTQITAVAQGMLCPASFTCGPTATSGRDGRYSLSLPSPGTYTIQATDSGTTTVGERVDLGPGQAGVADVRLPPPSVPPRTAAHGMAMALRLFNRERASAGLPAGIVLNPRWSQDCAAHDVYERDNHVLSHPEDSRLRGASVGGAWAGMHSVLAAGIGWTTTRSPWWTAPIHLIQLFSPSLSVIGIDASRGWDCATTWPGMLRAPVAADTIFTYPGDGSRGVPPAEAAYESPFVPGQFVGIPAGQVAGRELFVYLNQAGTSGQAQVTILAASLSAGPRPVAIRWVDNSTRTVGPYLSGGIILPVRRLRPHTRYTASVTVRDGSGSLSHRWSFTTGAAGTL